MNKIRVINAFRKNKHYFELIRKHNLNEGGIGIEPEVYKLIKKNSQGRTIDLGCGEGTYLSHFSGIIKNTNFFGVDISDIGISMSKRRGKLKLCQADLCNLPFRDKLFDFAYSQSVIEHVIDCERMINESSRILKKKGRLLIRVSNSGINNNRLIVIINYLLRRNKLTRKDPSLKLRKNSFSDQRSNFDLNEIPSDVLIRLLKKNNFRIIYFTTRRNAFLQSGELNKINNIRRFIITTFLSIPFFPFTHLGPTIIVLSEKR